MKKIMHERSLTYHLHNDLVVIDYVRKHTPVSVYDVIDSLSIDAIESVIRLTQLGVLDHAGGILRIRNNKDVIT